MRQPIKAFAAIFLAILAVAPAYAQLNWSDEDRRADSIRGYLNPERACYDVTYYDIWISREPRVWGYSAVYVEFDLHEKSDTIEFDLYPELKVKTVLLCGPEACTDALPFSRTPYKVRIAFPVASLGRYSIKIVYSGQPREAQKAPWDGGVVRAKTPAGEEWIGVACEGSGASIWWPCKDHLSDKPDSARMRIAYRGFPVSNGKLDTVYSGPDHSQVYEWKVTYPIHTYNITMNIAPYEHFQKTYKGTEAEFTQDFYFLEGAMDTVKAGFHRYADTMLTVFEKLFGGYPFPRDGYKLVQTPYWGMEHQSCISYGNHFKINDFGFDFILLHESAHEWWGNSVSCNDRAYMWIHEGFGTYAEALYVEQLQGHGRYLEYLRMQKPNIENQAAIQGPVNIYNTTTGQNYHAPDNDLYYKGSWMLHSLRSLTNNDSLFFATIRSLALDFRYKTVSGPEVEAYLAQKLGLDLQPFFDVYLRQAGLPVLNGRVVHKGRKSRLELYWENAPAGFRLPVQLEQDGKTWTVWVCSNKPALTKRHTDDFCHWEETGTNKPATTPVLPRKR